MSNSSENKGWIGVDLDRTLAFYDKWRGIDHIGEPIEPMLIMVRRFLAEGTTVKIFTARIAEKDEAELDAFKSAWYDYSMEHFGEVLECTNEKDFQCIMFFDDRAIAVEANTGRILSPLPANDWLPPDVHKNSS